MSYVWWWVERGLRLRRRNVNAAGDTRHGRWGTVRASMVSCGDQGSWSMSIAASVEELAWCSQAVPWDIESTACTVWRTRQVMVWSMSKCYGHRGVVYLWQTCRADSMWGHTSKICHTYSVESRVMAVLGCSATVFSSQLFGAFMDAAELGGTYRHDQQMLQDMF